MTRTEFEPGHQELVERIEADHFQGGEAGGINEADVKALQSIADVNRDAKRLLEATVGLRAEA